MLFWALLASGQIVLRKINGWTSIAQPLAEPTEHRRLTRYAQPCRGTYQIPAIIGTAANFHIDFGVSMPYDIQSTV
jgi:hypothetical protein